MLYKTPEMEMVGIMKILSSMTRVKILRIVFSAKKDLCVNQIASSVKISQSLASHQLAYLSTRGAIVGHRVGQTMCYLPAKNEVSALLIKLLKLLEGVKKI